MCLKTHLRPILGDSEPVSFLMVSVPGALVLVAITGGLTQAGSDGPSVASRSRSYVHRRHHQHNNKLCGLYCGRHNMSLPL